jgi:acyl-CoA-binding protein
MNARTGGGARRKPKPSSNSNGLGAAPGRYHRQTIVFQPGIIMSDLQARFEQAQIDVKGLSERPSNMTLLRLYALYKQGAEGDAHGDKPGFTDIVGRYKFEAWEGLKGTSQDEAKQKYIDLVEELKSGATT